MAFDFKKEYKEFYMPKNKPEFQRQTILLSEVREIQMKKVEHISKPLVCCMLSHIH